MTVVVNMHKPYFIFMSCHGYEGIMPVSFTPLQVKYYHLFLFHRRKISCKLKYVCYIMSMEMFTQLTEKVINIQGER